MKPVTPDTAHKAPSSSADLSDRQRQCLSLAARGLSSAGIGDQLGLSPRTVDEHLMTACAVLGVRTRIQAVARLAREARRKDEPRSFLP